jgi:hypothetical protein
MTPTPTNKKDAHPLTDVSNLIKLLHRMDDVFRYSRVSMTRTVKQAHM